MRRTLISDSFARSFFMNLNDSDKKVSGYNLTTSADAHIKVMVSKPEDHSMTGSRSLRMDDPLTNSESKMC